MKEILFEHPHRQKHFDFFNAMNHPHFNITANVDISNFLHFLKKKQISTTHFIVYLIAKSASSIKEFRWRIRDQKIVEHKVVHPSFSVFTEVADVFSFCTVEYDKQADVFLNKAKQKAQQMKIKPSFEDEEGRDDYLFLSAIPWVSFTGFQHAMHYHTCDSVPRIMWGKFFEQGQKIWMPLSVQAHHALVDGRHMGQFFEKMQSLCNNPSFAID